MNFLSLLIKFEYWIRSGRFDDFYGVILQKILRTKGLWPIKRGVNLKGVGGRQEEAYPKSLKISMGIQTTMHEYFTVHLISKYWLKSYFCSFVHCTNNIKNYADPINPVRPWKVYAGHSNITCHELNLCYSVEKIARKWCLVYFEAHRWKESSDQIASSWTKSLWVCHGQSWEGCCSSCL